MRKCLALVLTLFFLGLGFADHGRAQLTLMTGAGKGATAAAAYVGPGDVVGGAVSWWGLRGYTAAYSTGSNPAAQVCDAATGFICLNINVLANGDFDVAAAAGSTACAVQCKVITLFDQTGNNRHMVWNGNITQAPTLIFSAMGSLPGITFVSANNTFLTDGGAISQSQPFTVSAATKHTGSAALQCWLGSLDGPGYCVDNANTNYVFGGTASATQTETVNVFHALQGVFNGGSSTSTVNGATSAPGGGGTGTLGASTCLGSDGSCTPGQPYDGVLLETGVWSGSFNGTQISNINSNQRAYWGF